MSATKLVSFLLDRSGSMASMRETVVSGMHDYVQSIADDVGILMSLTQFDDLNAQERMCDFIPPREVRLNSFQPRGSTPLYDALNRNIEWVEGRVSEFARDGETVMLTDANGARYELKRDSAKPPVLIVVMTDGQENASHITASELNVRIKAKEAEGWTFIYLGVEKAAWAVPAAFMGTAMSASNKLRSTGREGLNAMYAAASSGTASWAANSGMGTVNVGLNDAEVKPTGGNA